MVIKDLNLAMEVILDYKYEHSELFRCAVEYVERWIENLNSYLDKQITLFQYPVETMIFKEDVEELGWSEIDRRRAYDGGYDKGFVEALKSIQKIIDLKMIRDDWKFTKEEVKNRTVV